MGRGRGREREEKEREEGEGDAGVSVFAQGYGIVVWLSGYIQHYYPFRPPSP